jgi:hypothetical protein
MAGGAGEENKNLIHNFYLSTLSLPLLLLLRVPFIVRRHRRHQPRAMF